MLVWDSETGVGRLPSGVRPPAFTHPTHPPALPACPHRTGEGEAWALSHTQHGYVPWRIFTATLPCTTACCYYPPAWIFLMTPTGLRLLQERFGEHGNLSYRRVSGWFDPLSLAFLASGMVGSRVHTEKRKQQHVLLFSLPPLSKIILSSSPILHARTHRLSGSVRIGLISG